MCPIDFDRTDRRADCELQAESVGLPVTKRGVDFNSVSIFLDIIFLREKLFRSITNITDTD